jgi:hypothetical protein
VNRERVGRGITVAATVVVAVAAAAFLWACWRNGSVGHPEVRADRWHHLYLGIALAAWGVARRNPALLALAALIAADDALQHVVQVSGTWAYVSPLHRMFAAYLWPLAPVKKLVALLNGVLG